MRGQFAIAVVIAERQHGRVRHAFEADVARRRRSQHLAFTWGDVFERPAQTIAELRAMLRARVRSSST